MAIIVRPNLKDATAYQQDDTTTADTVYGRFTDGTGNEYLTKRATVPPYTYEWTWGEWTDRATITSWVSINTQKIEV